MGGIGGAGQAGGVAHLDQPRPRVGGDRGGTGAGCGGGGRGGRTRRGGQRPPSPADPSMSPSSNGCSAGELSTTADGVYGSTAGSSRSLLVTPMAVDMASPPRQATVV